MTKKFLFISGCDRSGTTALVRLINSHQKVCIGMERYKGLIKTKELLKTLKPERFNESSFFDIRDNETNIQWDYFYDALKDKYKDALVIGDKVPRYFQVYDSLEINFPNAKHIFIIRDPIEVANSWKVRANDSGDINWVSSNNVDKSVTVWNRSLKEAYKKKKKGELDILFISYSKLFSGDLNELDRVVNHLGIDCSQELLSLFSKMTDGWNERVSKELSLTDKEINFVNESTNTDLADYILKKYK